MMLGAVRLASPMPLRRSIKVRGIAFDLCLSAAKCLWWQVDLKIGECVSGMEIRQDQECLARLRIVADACVEPMPARRLAGYTTKCWVAHCAGSAG